MKATETTEYEKCILRLVEYKNKSILGNPSYWVCFTDAEGKMHHGYTMSNSSAGYEIKNYCNRESGTIIYLKYHFTRKTGQCVIDCIKHNSLTDVKN